MTGQKKKVMRHSPVTAFISSMRIAWAFYVFAAAYIITRSAGGICFSSFAIGLPVALGISSHK